MHLITHMWRHSNAIVILFALLALGFGASVFFGTPMLAVAVLLSGVVVVFVLSIAWMRPGGGSVEHHPKIDKLFDDTAP